MSLLFNYLDLVPLNIFFRSPRMLLSLLLPAQLRVRTSLNLFFRNRFLRFRLLRFQISETKSRRFSVPSAWSLPTTITWLSSRGTHFIYTCITALRNIINRLFYRSLDITSNKWITVFNNWQFHRGFLNITPHFVLTKVLARAWWHSKKKDSLGKEIENIGKFLIFILFIINFFSYF